MRADRQVHSGAGWRLDTVHAGAVAATKGGRSVRHGNWEKPNRPVIRDDQSSAMVAVTNQDAEDPPAGRRCDAQPDGIGIPAPGSATMPRNGGTGLATSERPSTLRSCN